MDEVKSVTSPEVCCGANEHGSGFGHLDLLVLLQQALLNSLADHEARHNLGQAGHFGHLFALV